MSEEGQLEKLGYVIHRVATGEAAVAHALDAAMRPSLIIMEETGG
ncbi:MAG: hypothetical protein ACOCU4_00825 [Alkalispirochaeta sp.]